jgi:hypothetical protein
MRFVHAAVALRVRPQSSHQKRRIGRAIAARHEAGSKLARTVPAGIHVRPEAPSWRRIHVRDKDLRQMAFIHNRAITSSIGEAYGRNHNSEARVHTNAELPSIPFHLGAIDGKIWTIPLLDGNGLERRASARDRFRIIPCGLLRHWHHFGIDQLLDSTLVEIDGSDHTLDPQYIPLQKYRESARHVLSYLESVQLGWLRIISSSLRRCCIASL